MKLKDQVCSFELAKRLKDLGVEQKSLFFWNYDDFGSSENLENSNFKGWIDNPNWRKASAFTVAELGEMLPEGYQTYRLGYKWFNDAKSQDEMGWVSKPELIFDAFETEADARAKILIHLIETGKLKKEDLC